MPKKPSLRYVETEGGPFILLPLELKKSWRGSDDADEGKPDDYSRAASFGTSVGVLEVGAGQALILGTVEVTAFHPLDDGGVFIQRVFGDDDAAVIAVVEKALPTKWKPTKLQFNVGKGKLALFDSAYDYADSDADERLPVTLRPGTYEVLQTNAKAKDIELGLVRLRSV